MKKIAAFVISHEDKTITITKEFYKRSSNPSTKEFKDLAALHKSYGDYEIMLRTANFSDGKQTHKGLTVEMMKKYIQTLDNAEEALKEFERAQEYYGSWVEDKNNPDKKVLKVPYGKIKSWFLKKYPKYEDIDFAA